MEVNLYVLDHVESGLLDPVELARKFAPYRQEALSPNLCQCAVVSAPVYSKPIAPDTKGKPIAERLNYELGVGLEYSRRLAAKKGWGDEDDEWEIDNELLEAVREEMKAKDMKS